MGSIGHISANLADMWPIEVGQGSIAAVRDIQKAGLFKAFIKAIILTAIITVMRANCGRYADGIMAVIDR
jgi:hypothetical protein